MEWSNGKEDTLMFLRALAAREDRQETSCPSPASPLLLPLAIVLERPEQRALDVGAMADAVEAGADARRGLRVDCQHAPRGRRRT
jgi:hypothetical protein